jgi:hypothetical protein
MTPITTLLIATANHSVNINAITRAASVPTPIATTMRLIKLLAESFGSRSLRLRLRQLRNQQPHKPFVALFQLGELTAEALDLAPLAEGQLLPV